jgi:hypothetical protein
MTIALGEEASAMSSAFKTRIQGTTANVLVCTNHSTNLDENIKYYQDFHIIFSSTTLMKGILIEEICEQTLVEISGA